MYDSTTHAAAADTTTVTVATVPTFRLLGRSWQVVLTEDVLALIRDAAGVDLIPLGWLPPDVGGERLLAFRRDPEQYALALFCAVAGQAEAAGLEPDSFFVALLEEDAWERTTAALVAALSVANPGCAWLRRLADAMRQKYLEG